ncbi:MAG: alpha/beta fold hydrolase [Anaerolineales bacterium]
MPVAANLYYFLHEDGGAERPPLILIHGVGGNYQLWPPEIRRMAGQRVLALDLPGHGKSEGPGLQSVTDYARHLVAFMKAVGLYKAVIGGHDLGGAIALEMAIEHPKWVAGIALLASGARLPVASARLEAAANPSMYAALVRQLQQSAFGPQAPEQARALLGRVMAGTRPTVFYGDLLACNHLDLSSRLSNVRVPTLILCGSQDRTTPLSFSEDLASGIRGAALQILDGAGHMLMLEQPRRVAGLLRLFLQTIPWPD